MKCRNPVGFLLLKFLYKYYYSEISWHIIFFIKFFFFTNVIFWLLKNANRNKIIKLIKILYFYIAALLFCCLLPPTRRKKHIMYHIKESTSGILYDSSVVSHVSMFKHLFMTKLWEHCEKCSLLLHLSPLTIYECLSSILYMITIIST